MKKIVNVLTVFSLVIALSIGTVLANPNPQAEGTVVSHSLSGTDIDIKFNMDDLSKFDDITSNEVLAQINRLNASEDIKTVLGESFVSTHKIEGYQLLTQVLDLMAYDTTQTRRYVENVSITWEVPSLTADMTVLVLHYSIVSKQWEVIQPDRVDVNKHQITTTFPNLSPVAVIYKTKDNFEEKTGDSTNYEIYAIMAGISLLAVAIIIVILRKKDNFKS